MHKFMVSFFFFHKKNECPQGETLNGLRSFSKFLSVTYKTKVHLFVYVLTFNIFKVFLVIEMRSLFIYMSLVYSDVIVILISCIGFKLGGNYWKSTNIKYLRAKKK